MARLKIDGYGQLEMNNCAFPRDGRVEAQCKLDPDDFKDIPCENGMILAVDNVKRVVKLPKNTDFPVAIVYSAEHLYDERKSGLKDFALTVNDGVYPRLGYLSTGDKFTTNTIELGEYKDEDALKTAVDAGTVYGTTDASGAIKVQGTRPESLFVLKAIKNTTMPDGQYAIKFQVYSEA